MKIISWNCRGLGNRPTVRALQGLIHSEAPDVVFVMETKLSSSELLHHRGMGGLSGIFPVSCAGGGKSRSGGLGLLWREEIQIGVIHASLNHILFNITHPVTSDVMQIMAVYGFPEERFKARTWDLVRRAKPPHPMPWLCIGDFNDIISPADKLGGDVPDMGRLQVANQACNECDFHDVGFSGYRFTWSNMREAPNTVEERLDFALANSDWSCMWPVTKVRHFINYKSDHCPIVLTCSSRRGHRELARTKLFRFKELWLQSGDECSEVVAEAWSRTWSGDDIHGKFEAVSGALGSWGK
ncbi:uncharacterized protein LOC130719838 [Lotus japonicus]|uniref:uncharacterized protein LOC130719838 n=1 Tax=Lotus japonicus TaxID=34305 RepID=UPI0025865797|nr:uncharacterized protein LOC130719838 [Lotus japonicus]